MAECESAQAPGVASLTLPFSLTITLLATIGGFLFGYDQGVVGNVLVLESFGAEFPRFFADESVKVSSWQSSREMNSNMLT